MSDKNTFDILLPVVVAGVVVAVGDIDDVDGVVGDDLSVVTADTCVVTKSNK